jgi:YidC/Oxa1 family membrane protein insertase
VVETDLYVAEFSSFGGRLKRFELKEYAVTAQPGSAPLDMVASDSLLPLGLYWTSRAGVVEADTPLTFELEASSLRIRGDEESVVSLRAQTPEGNPIVKRLRLRANSYVIDYQVDIGSGAAQAIGVAWARRINPATDHVTGTEGPVAHVDGSLHTEIGAKLAEPVSMAGAIDWAGYADHYFLAAYVPAASAGHRFVAAASAGVAEAQLWKESTDGGVSYELFIGPKSIRLLGKLGHHLEAAVDLGYFTIVARPLLELLFFLNRFVANFGVAIILLTVGIRIVFYPINQRQVAAMKSMQRIQPELRAIQEKYKDDRERMNKEVMETYRRHKVNPLAGCLPMLLQIPVFIGLYNALLQAIELRHAPFVGWIQDLSQPDRLGTLPIPFVAPPGIPVMTLLMGASMVIQQRMTPSMGDPAQQRMMMILPVVFTVMFVNFPSGLVLYWLANNIMMIGQQYLTNRSGS